MTVEESITHWVNELRRGSPDAAAQIWHRYYEQMIALACKRLRGSRSRAADEEDVVLSAFESFFRRAQQGQFPDLQDRDDLWSVLLCITERKALNQIRDQNRLKRGGGKVKGESGFVQADGQQEADFDQLAGREPTPEFSAAMVDSMDHLLAQLDDEELRQIALLKLEAYTNDEIADNIGRSIATVERRLRLIRNRWQRASEAPSG